MKLPLIPGTLVPIAVVKTVILIHNTTTLQHTRTSINNKLNKEMNSSFTF